MHKYTGLGIKMESVGGELGSNISVREILPSEERLVRELFERNLGLINRLFFLLALRDAINSAKKQLGISLVAVYDGTIVGSVSLRILVYAEKMFGLIDAIVTDKGLRGRGVGKLLLDGALSWFEEKECGAVHATADRYNSPSWNMFIHKGFSTYELEGQLRGLGLSFVRLWFAEFYIVGAGTFFLRKTSHGDRSTEAGEVRHFLVAWLGFSLLLWVLAFRQGGLFVVIPLALGVAGMSLFAHEISHRLAASRFGLETTFKAWDSGILFSSFLAVVLGALYPAYGSTYMKQVDWRYGSKQREMGLICLAGPAVSFMLAALFQTLLMHVSNGILLMIAKMGYAANLYSAIFNLIPIQAAGGFAWDRGKIFTWNRVVWLLLTVAVATLILIDFLL